MGTRCALNNSRYQNEIHATSKLFNSLISTYVYESLQKPETVGARRIPLTMRSSDARAVAVATCDVPEIRCRATPHVINLLRCPDKSIR